MISNVRNLQHIELFIFIIKINYLVALDRADGRKVDGRRVVVDYERGRTRQEWVPRRLGGGKGDKRRDRDGYFFFI